MMNDVFDLLLDGEIVNGIKLCEFNTNDYKTYSLDTLDENEVVNGVTYTPHYAFINIENDECAYIGLLYRDVDGEQDVKFRVTGASYEVHHDGGWCDFDTMFKMLTEN